jgi:hypothetical protein
MSIRAFLDGGRAMALIATGIGGFSLTVSRSRLV